MKTLYWSRVPGRFVNKNTGKPFVLTIEGKQCGPTFTGTVREWYETFVETTIDLYNQLKKEAFSKVGEHSVESAELFAGSTAQLILETSVLYHSDGTIGTRFKLIPTSCDANVAQLIMTVKDLRGKISKFRGNVKVVDTF